jgi:pseudaminic acid synthase
MQEFLPADGRVMIIAEMSANHLGDREHAMEIVRAAHAAGADAIKLQTFTSKTITLDVADPRFKAAEGTPWAGRTLASLYEEAHTPWEWHKPLKEEASRLGLSFLSSPFDHTAVDFLDELGVVAFKIASPEIIDIPLIERVARTQRPCILSTGMATLSEVDEAVRAFRKRSDSELVLLKCTSAYPAPWKDMNLRAMQTLAEAFAAPVGLSDHSPGFTAAVAAVALGARVIEKHLTLSRKDGGPDAGFSLEPDEFAELVRNVRAVEEALGNSVLGPRESELPHRRFRRSLFLVSAVRKGEVLTGHHVRSIRPGDGLPPKFLPQVLGAKARRDLPMGEPLTWDCLDFDTETRKGEVG